MPSSLITGTRRVLVSFHLFSASFLGHSDRSQVAYRDPAFRRQVFRAPKLVRKVGRERERERTYIPLLLRCIFSTHEIHTHTQGGRFQHLLRMIGKVFQAVCLQYDTRAREIPVGAHVGASSRARPESWSSP